ncbi:MAG: amidohydrolase [Verrucomicrobiae bacterium]|nr:amidohydrolase [Verrucomicrobiae bacterium]
MSTQAPTHSDTPPLSLVDTHQHLWDLSRFKYTWCAEIPVLHKSFLLRDYLDASKNATVVKTVFMECDVDEPFMRDEIKWILSQADGKPLSGLIIAGRPESKDFPKYIEEFAGDKRIKGVRRVLHVAPDETSQTPLFAENVRQLKQYGLTYDICMQACQLPLAIGLIKKCPEVQFILDHCGGPDVKSQALDPWRAHIKQIAAFPNVVCKVSGIIASADPKNWRTDDLRPFVEHVLECFGWDRVVWGSDWPVCTLTATYQQWVDAALAITKNAKPADREKLFAKNAERVYRV